MNRVDTHADTAFLETLGRLTRGALHELANPLVAVLGSAELALLDAEPGTKLHDRIDLVHRTAQEVAEIVRVLQGFTRERGTPPRRLALADTAGDAVRLVARVGANPDVELRLRREAEPTVVAPAGAVLQAIVAALLDGLSAADRDALLEVAVREDGADAVVTVDGVEVLRLPAEASP